MALIKCPECSKEISDKCDICINCGYPIKNATICNLNGKECDLYFILDESISRMKRVAILRQLCNCGLKTAADTINDILEKQEIPKVLNLPIQQVEEDNKPKCPTCGSSNIKPITATERATSIIGLGIFSKKINKTYKCLNCKCTW